jgi:D-threo-aldose 1-dehydrogenase
MTADADGAAARAGRLGLGTAGLYGLPRSRDRIDLVREAVDLGIGHIDVAPMYGLGIAEQELGRALRGLRDRVTVATKFGIDARGWTRLAARAQGPLRSAASRFQGLGQAARTHAVGPGVGFAGSVIYRSTGFDAPAARRGLTASLRRLRLDHIDLLLLHDPGPDVALTGVVEFLEEAVRRGEIRSWGVAGEQRDALLVADRLSVDPPTLQLRWDSLQLQPIDPRGSTLITFGALGSALPRIEAFLGARPEARSHWSSVLGVDCSRRESIAALLLADALDRNPDGVTLFSTTGRAHLRRAAELSDQRPATALAGFRALARAVPAGEGVAA